MTNTESAPSSAEDGLRVVAAKASTSLTRREEQIIRKWLQSVIEDLELESLQSLPTQTLSTSFPLLIDTIAQSIKGPTAKPFPEMDLSELAAAMATMRKGDPEAAKVFNDYSTLKKLFIEAAAMDLRDSDHLALQVFQRLDDSFMQFFRAGLEAFIEQRSLELRRIADTDALTGLYNVRYFVHQLDESLNMYRRYSFPFSLLMLDVDRLKKLNDRNGHAAGDLALLKLAEVMNDEKREMDIAVRTGGDEFFLILPGTGIGDAEALAHRIVDGYKKAVSQNGRKVTSVSIGMVSCPLHGEDADVLRGRADAALYEAKKAGGGAIARYPKEP